jgi:hypothetical protein
VSSGLNSGGVSAREPKKDDSTRNRRTLGTRSPNDTKQALGNVVDGISFAFISRPVSTLGDQRSKRCEIGPKYLVEHSPLPASAISLSCFARSSAAQDWRSGQG